MPLVKASLYPMLEALCDHEDIVKLLKGEGRLHGEHPSVTYFVRTNSFHSAYSLGLLLIASHDSFQCFRLTRWCQFLSVHLMA